MSEYARNEHFQWCDTELCMIIDAVTGRIERCIKNGRDIGVIVNFEDALNFAMKSGLRARLVIVKAHCVAPFGLPERKNIKQ